MAREIKFRIWDGNEIIYPVKNAELAFVDGNIPKFNVWSQGGEHLYEVKVEVLMQYTGLKDKNDKEIYEGDIVSEYQPDYDSTVDWEDDDERWKTPIPLFEKTRDVVTLENHGYWLKNENFGWEGEGLVSPQNCEVIGNIYENPDLLK